jgi:hypothetical protein
LVLAVVGAVELFTPARRTPIDRRPLPAKRNFF